MKEEQILLHDDLRKESQQKSTLIMKIKLNRQMIIFYLILILKTKNKLKEVLAN